MRVGIPRAGRALNIDRVLKANSTASVRGGDIDSHLVGMQLAGLGPDQQRPGLSVSVVHNTEYRKFKRPFSQPVG